MTCTNKIRDVSLPTKSQTTFIKDSDFWAYCRFSQTSYHSAWQGQNSDDSVVFSKLWRSYSLTVTPGLSLTIPTLRREPLLTFLLAPALSTLEILVSILSELQSPLLSAHSSVLLSDRPAPLPLQLFFSACNYGSAAAAAAPSGQCVTTHQETMRYFILYTGIIIVVCKKKKENLKI